MRSIENRQRRAIPRFAAEFMPRLAGDYRRMGVHRQWRGMISGFVVFALCAMNANEIRAADQYSQDALKAAYLYRFAGYIEWPGTPNTEVFTIAVLDAEGVVKELE